MNSEVKSFSSLEEMGEYLREQGERASRDLHDAQRGLTFGSHWVRFDSEVVEFGRVHTIEEVALSELESGETWEHTMAIVGHTANDLMGGLMYGKAYSALNPDGEFGNTHKANAWPIDVSLFDAVKAVDWDFDRLDEDMRALLVIAHTGYFAHRRVLAER